jgi:ribosomal 50S subunit-recycling heat shock protein
MRLDLYLKYVDLFKRRTLAQESIHKNRIRVNDNLVKPSYQIKPNDIIDVYLKTQHIKIRVLSPIGNYETIFNRQS